MDEEARAALDGHTPPGTVPNLPAVMGRPSTYNEAVVARICEAIANGVKTRELPDIEGFPGKSTVFRWLREHVEFAIEYAYAQEWKCSCVLDDLIEIADDDAHDYEIIDASAPADGSEPSTSLKAMPTIIQRSKLKIDTRKYWLSKTCPKKYGDTPAVEQALVLPTPIDNMRLVNPTDPKLIEHHPLAAAYTAIGKAIKQCEAEE